jgi:hypothetical protein
MGEGRCEVVRLAVLFPPARPRRRRTDRIVSPALCGLLKAAALFLGLLAGLALLALWALLLGWALS